MNQSASKIAEAVDHLTEAAAHLPQDNPYQAIKRAQVALGSALAEVDALAEQIGNAPEVIAALRSQNDALILQSQAITAENETLRAQLTAATAPAAPEADPVVL